MGLLDEYRAQLKPIDVEEPIDYWVHRPLAFVVARVLYPTPISPNLVTVLAILAGLGGAVCIAWPFRMHMQLGGLLIFSSAVLDCADGQLARMRKSSSAFGRMLDGVADLCVVSGVAPATLYAIWRPFAPPASPMWLGVTVVALGLVTIVTSSFHTSMYDHYKNVWLRFTSPSFKEGEDHDAALARYEATRGEGSFVREITWRIYLFYVKGQEDYVQKFDPFTAAALGKLPPYSTDNERIYRAHVASPWTTLRRYFGFGSLMFGLAVANALELGAAYLLVRLVVLNGVFFLHVRPKQRAASRAAFEEMRASGGAPVAV